MNVNGLCQTGQVRCVALISIQHCIAPWWLCGELARWADGGELDFVNTAHVKHKLKEFERFHSISH